MISIAIKATGVQQLRLVHIKLRISIVRKEYAHKRFGRNPLAGLVTATARSHDAFA